jgi:CBS domain-containing protein
VAASWQTQGGTCAAHHDRLPTQGLTQSLQRLTHLSQAIRKKIEADLLRKSGKAAPSTPSGGRRGARKAARPAAVAGTVSALRPLPALTVPQSISVADASQLCAAKRTDCVLVVDDDEHLAGIFTAKDLAFRVSGTDAPLRMRC